MNKPQFVPSASSARRLRRPLTEFTLPAASGADWVKPSPAQATRAVQPRLALWRDEASRPKAAARRKTAKPKHATESSGLTARDAPQTKPLDNAGTDRHDVLHALHHVTSAAAKAGKDYRSCLFEHMTKNISAALGYASGLATMSITGRLDANAASREPERRVQPGNSNPAEPVSAPEIATSEFCAKAFALMAANVTATLEYVRRLSDVKLPSEFVELSASHARKQVDLAMTHTAALRTLSKSSARSTAERQPTPKK